MLKEVLITWVVAEEVRRSLGKLRHPPTGDVLDVAETARFLGVERNTVCQYADRGEIPHKRLDAKLVFSRPALVAWLGDDGPQSGNRRESTE